MKKQLLACLCALSMVFTMIPTTVYAEEISEESVETVTFAEEATATQDAAATIKDYPSSSKIVFSVPDMPDAAALTVNWNIYDMNGQLIAAEKGYEEFDIYPTHCQTELSYQTLSFSIYDSGVEFDDLNNGTYIMKSSYTLYAPGWVAISQGNGPDYTFSLIAI